MSNLVVSVFDDEFRAQEVRIDILKRRKEHLADFEDAVVIQISETGQVKLHSVSHLTLEGFIGGGFLGSLLGLLLLNPVFALFGLATGAIAGAVSGSMSHVGISEEFIRELAEHLKPGTWRFASWLANIWTRFSKRLQDTVARCSNHHCSTKMKLNF